MSNPLTGISSNGGILHYSVGAVIEHSGKYLLIDRKEIPLGYAGLAGHVDDGEDFDNAIVREVEEESNLKIVNKELLFEEEILWNFCKTAPSHKWRLYSCIVEGEVRQNIEEEKSIGWYTPDEMQNMNLEPVWRYWFEKLGIINNKI